MGSSPCGHKGHSLPLVLRSEVALELFGGFHPNSCRSQPCSVVSSRLAKQYCKFDANGLLRLTPCTDRCRLRRVNPRDICCQGGRLEPTPMQCLECHHHFGLPGSRLSLVGLPGSRLSLGPWDGMRTTFPAASFREWRGAHPPPPVNPGPARQGHPNASPRPCAQTRATAA
jgi:hypothetical protein